MTKSEIVCDLCQQAITGKSATLNVPKTWDPSVVQQVDGGWQWLLTATSQVGTPRDEFDICRACAEALMQSRIWLQQVMKGELGR